jgi:hypothetical protein
MELLKKPTSIFCFGIERGFLDLSLLTFLWLIGIEGRINWTEKMDKPPVNRGTRLDEGCLKWKFFENLFDWCGGRLVLRLSRNRVKRKP